MPHAQATTLLLSTAYCGPVPYFAAMARYGRVVMEQHENYIKQTYRNRCVILGSNGPLSLVIPVEQGRRPGLKIRDTRIVWYERWQVNHWRTISSAYRNSPYFDYYADEIRPFYEKKWDYLFDFNLEYLELLLDLTGLSASVGLPQRSAGDDDTAQWAPHSSTVGMQQRSAGDGEPAQSARHSSIVELTEAFEQLPEPFLNLREAISPKVPVSTALPEYRDVLYTQVFEGKFPFMPGLSVLDLLFNTGPETPDILRRSWL